MNCYGEDAVEELLLRSCYRGGHEEGGMATAWGVLWLGSSYIVSTHLHHSVIPYMVLAIYSMHKVCASFLAGPDIFMMAHSKNQARKSVVRPLKVKVKKVMAVMSQWWQKHYDKTYKGSSDEEENDDEEASEQEANNCPPPPKKKKIKGEDKKKKKMHDVTGSRLFPRVADDNIETLKTFKWPAFVLDWLVNEIRNYKDRASKGRGQFGKGVGGNLFVLIRFIKMYKDLMRQFVINAQSLHEMDASMIESNNGSPIGRSHFGGTSEHGSLPDMSPSISPQDGP
ncbi:hypothetical protein RHMOL_Rhmol02G0198300 [Rhododendron molle]|uniref:Uncharacterized protein n=1 Tax=Rhododendron molle TaxID=49168 RepID=A0ACC0PTU6_RHOML|nr:hypothetical protein RHMOL_Rhmol02G0198300 [Rhododendron molle]